MGCDISYMIDLFFLKEIRYFNEGSILRDLIIYFIMFLKKSSTDFTILSFKLFQNLPFSLLLVFHVVFSLV